MKLHTELQTWNATQAAAADVDAVLAAVTDDGTEQTITTGLTKPPAPRSLSVTFGGTAADIKAISVTVNGERNGKVISEAIGPATVNTAGTVHGSKIFDEVTSVVIPAHDGNGATTSVGFGDKLGLSYKPPINHIVRAEKDGAVDGSATMTVGASLEDCYLTMSNAMDGDVVKLVHFR